MRIRSAPKSFTAELTSAMEAGLSDHVWTIAELVELLETERQQAA
jgi:hypothetical protein